MPYTRREFIQRFSALGMGGLAAMTLPGCISGKTKHPRNPLNILFIIVDDLRPELGCYGHPLVQSPHIDSLAQSGILFERAYCQQALCAPSRASLLTGKRPDTTQITDLQTTIRQTIPHTVTLPQRFKEYGYFSRGMGKVFHNGQEDAASYSVPHANARGAIYALPENAKHWKKEDRLLLLEFAKGKKTQNLWVPSVECADVADNVYKDGTLTEMAVDALRRLAPGAGAGRNNPPRQPFFLSVGFSKPHLPFCAPKKYWDLYDRSQIPLPHPRLPLNAPAIAESNWKDLRLYSDIPDAGPCDEAATRQLIHGYYACVSFIDAQIGRLLHTLDELQLRRNTIIVLIGDHGWKLGDYSLWCKHTNFEPDVRSPLIISAPNGPRNVKTRALTEFVDIYPTLCDLCGVEPPNDLEGTSMTPLFANPSKPWKNAVFSQYPRGPRIMGRSMRTEHYRYTEWRRSPGNQTAAVELYDLTNDLLGKENLAVRPDYAPLVQRMKTQLELGWRNALPPR